MLVARQWFGIYSANLSTMFDHITHFNNLGSFSKSVQKRMQAV